MKRTVVFLIAALFATSQPLCKCEDDRGPCYWNAGPTGTSFFANGTPESPYTMGDSNPGRLFVGPTK